MGSNSDTTEKPLVETIVAQRPLTYYWVAFFTDKTAIPQFDLETGIENSFKTVQKLEHVLTGMSWMPFTHELAKKVSLHTSVHVNLLLKPCTVVLSEGQRIIIFRRGRRVVTMGVSNGKASQSPGPTTYVLGWQETRSGRNYKSLMYLYEDGGVKMVSGDTTPGGKIASHGGVFGGLS